MGWWKDLQQAVVDAENAKNKKPRDLTSADLVSWDDAMMSRDRTAAKTVEQVRQAIRYKNPIRWMQLQGDIRWVKREMKKMGMNPEDYRWLL